MNLYKVYSKEYSKEVIEVGDKLLKVSCRKAKERSRKTDGVYKNVKCSFSRPKKFRDSLWNNKKFMKKWFEYTTVFMEKNEDRRYRPVIDRIDGKGHYYLSNIQPLNYSENSSKAQVSKRKKARV